MNRILLVLCLSVLGAQGTGWAQGFQGFADHSGQSGGQNNGILLGPKETYLEPVRPNTYGPGIHADATGRPFQWQPRPDQGGESAPDPTLRVTPNQYGFGVHADQYGRVVEPTCPVGQLC